MKMQAAFRGRKHTITQNVLAAVDFDLRFTYVLAGWEGSTHDALILSDALERDDGLRVPPGIIQTKKTLTLCLILNETTKTYSYLLIFRQILSCRCWLCSGAWFLATISCHKVPFKGVWFKSASKSKRAFKSKAFVS